MLGKLFKHEFMETYKLILAMNIVVVGMSIIGAILLRTGVYDLNDYFRVIAVSSLMFYILGIFAIFIVVLIYITLRFYKTMYANQGYLTHTLPVTSASVINTKLLVSVFWFFVTSCLTTSSIYLLVRSAITEWDTPSFSEIGFFSQIYSSTGITIFEFIVTALLTFLVTAFTMILMIYASLAVGQLFNQHRVAASIVTFIVFYIVRQILSSIRMTGLAILGNGTYSHYGSYADVIYFRGTIWSYMLLTAVYGIIFYVICQYVTNKHLNLE